MDNWQLWFVRLSGWPVFITVIIAGVLVGWLASVLLTKAASRSAVQTMLFAVVAIAIIGLLPVLIAVGLTRRS
jgi:uncharacterized membrane protein YeaQ/YmgE (transglycosylase-associated protein family)